MDNNVDYGRWHPGDLQSHCQIIQYLQIKKNKTIRGKLPIKCAKIAVFLFLLVVISVFAIYGGLSQGAIMSLLGFVPMFMAVIKKENKKKKYRMSSIEQKFGIESSVDETAICITDPKLSNVKGQRRKKFSYSRVFSLFRSKPEPSTDIFTISGDICEMEDIEFGRSKDRKEKKKNKDKDRDYFSSLDQLLLSLLNVGMMRKC